ncbi:MAG TPA: exopolysaccharide biosynthesis protein [Thermoleophilaceae bacterium]|nr:exopolysaccharide biosynthesis protein [Thermoleophilaceae bacterium]
MDAEASVGDQLEGWMRADGPKTLGGLIELFGEKSFAIVFVLLLAVPALPLPTGGATHVFEAIAMLLALELIVGRRTIWLPGRLRRRDLKGLAQGRVATTLLKQVRRVERFARPRLGRVVRTRLAGVLFGVIVLVLSVVAFVAPPFSGLDTLPALGIVVLSLGFLFEDAVLAIAGIVVGALGAALVIGLGTLVTRFVRDLF